MTYDETIVLRVTVIGGKRHPDDYQVIWGRLPIGRIMKRDGVPHAEQWWWGITFYGKPSLSSNNGGGTDLQDCIAKFKAAWTGIRADLTAADIAKAYEMRLAKSQSATTSAILRAGVTPPQGKNAG